jgi:hypothetical protein
MRQSARLRKNTGKRQREDFEGNRALEDYEGFLVRKQLKDALSYEDSAFDNVMSNPKVKGALRKAGTAGQLLTRVREREEAFKALFQMQELYESDSKSLLTQLKSDANFSPLIEHFAVGSDETFRAMLNSFAAAHYNIMDALALRSDLQKIWFSHVGRELAVFPHPTQLEKHAAEGVEWRKKVEARFEEIEQCEDATRLIGGLESDIFDFEIPQEEWERRVREERWKNFIEWSDLKKTVPSVVLNFLTSQVPNEFPDDWKKTGPSVVLKFLTILDWRGVLRKRIRIRYEEFNERFVSPLNAKVS